MAAGRILTLRELNRATLARQLLLERASLPVTAAVERLVGLQAQLPLPPYIGLWTRLPGFRRDDLARLIEGSQETMLQFKAVEITQTSFERRARARL